MQHRGNKCVHMANSKQGQPEGCWQKTPRPSLLLHFTVWNLNIQGNKNTSLWCPGKMTTVQLSPGSCERAHVTWGTSLLFVSRYWSSAEIKGLWEALIRGWAVSRVSYEMGPPTRVLFLCTMSPGSTERQALKGRLFHSVVRFHSNADAGGGMTGQQATLS